MKIDIGHNNPPNPKKAIEKNILIKNKLI